MNFETTELELSEMSETIGGATTGGELSVIFSHCVSQGSLSITGTSISFTGGFYGPTN